MLVHLAISNLAIISHLETLFRPGLNILSGETGAGKSIIINAVNLILGGRASSDSIRSGADDARVEALFSVPEESSINALLEEQGFSSGKELLIKRNISREGRNRITINGSMATLQVLSRIGQTLISISGQHEHQLLLKPENHLHLLDDFGGLTGERMELCAVFNRHLSLKENRHRLKREIKEAEERQELTRYQMEEIEKADIRQGEDKLLEEERNRLRYSEELLGIVRDSYHVLYEKEGAVLSQIALCVKRMEKGAEIDPRVKALRETLGSVKVEIEEAALNLRDLQGSITADPSRLEEMEERLQRINRLKRKYGPSLEEVMRFKEKLSGMIENLDQKKGVLEKVSQEIDGLEKEIIARAAELSDKRKRIAKGLEKAVKDELGLLEMSGTRFEARFHEDCAGGDALPEDGLKGMRPDGYDRVEFMLSTNVGEEMKPLSRIASGGELSRIMLALKTILARKGSVETIIFDEIDSGIGGGTAEVVGEKLQSLAAFHQILCITHLPQIASKGDTHFLVKKSVADTRTRTTISELTSEERVKEIARLMGGKTISPKALAHAKEILG